MRTTKTAQPKEKPITVLVSDVEQPVQKTVTVVVTDVEPEKPVTGLKKLRNELHTLTDRAIKALETAEAMSPDLPERDDLVGYVRRAVIALGHAEGTTY